MNWIQKIAQPTQMMLDFPDADLSYYQAFGDIEYHSGFCAYCNKQLTAEDEYEDIWVLTGKKGSKLQFSIDQQRFLDRLQSFFPQAEAFLEQKAQSPDPAATEDRYNIQTGQWETPESPPTGVLRWDIPLKYSEWMEIDNHLKTLLHQSISSGESPFFGTPGADRYVSSIDRLFMDFNTLGEARNALDTLKARLPQFLAELSEQYGSRQTYTKVPVCIECAEKNLVQCENCGEMVDENDALASNKVYSKEVIHYCHNCEESTVECEWCNNRVDKNNIMFIGADSTYEGEEYTLCEKCLYDADWIYCDSCGRYVTNEYNIRQNNEDVGCPDCVGDADSMDLAHYNGVLRELGLKKRGGLPLHPEKIQKLYLPFFQRYLGKYGSKLDKEGYLDSGHVLAIAQKQNIRDPEILKTIEFLASQPPEQIISLLEQTIEFHTEFKEKYPKLKGVSNIPATFEMVPSHGSPDIPHMTVAMKPSQMLMKFAQFLFPAAQDIWDRIKWGHHNGSIAYVRIGASGEDDDTWLINNIQSDADLQSLSNSTRAKYQMIWKQYADDPKSVDMQSREVQEALAAGFWNKTFRNWQAILIDVVRQVALAENKTLYMTSMEIQEARWNRIPERSFEAYERIPLQMGGEKEQVRVKPQQVPEDKWNVIRLANWLQRISGGNKYTMSRRWNMPPNVTEEALNWLATLGYGEQEVAHLTLDDIRKLAIL